MKTFDELVASFRGKVKPRVWKGLTKETATPEQWAAILDYRAAERIRDREKMRNRERERYAADPEKFRAKAREKYRRNRDSKLAYAARYREENREKVLAATEAWRDKNREYVRQQSLKWHHANKERAKANAAKWRKENSKRFKKLQADWRARNREHIREYARLREKSLSQRLATRIRNRLNHAVKNGQKSGSAIRDLGCSIDHLMQHIESQFAAGMSWSNWGTEWHLDHIFPVSAADLSDPAEFGAVCNWRNLQPLGKVENIRKSDSVSRKARRLFEQLKAEFSENDS